jgi:hypothetical protein
MLTLENAARSVYQEKALNCARNQVHSKSPEKSWGGKGLATVMLHHNGANEKCRREKKLRKVTEQNESGRKVTQQRSPKSFWKIQCENTYR